MQIKSSLHKIKGMNKDSSYSTYSPEYTWENKNIRVTARDANNLFGVSNERGNTELKFNLIHVYKIGKVDVSNVGFKKAYMSGYVEVDDYIYERGFCLNTLGLTPTISDLKFKYEGVGNNMNIGLLDLDAGGNYSANIYVIDVNGNISYSSETRFSTMSVSTKSAKLYNYTSIDLAGSINSYNPNGISSVGFCYSKNQNPTISDLHTIDTKGYNFSSRISGLDFESTYYVRAYAINSEGIFYGEQEQFETYDRKYEYKSYFNNNQFKYSYQPVYTYVSEFNNYEYKYINI